MKLNKTLLDYYSNNYEKMMNSGLSGFIFNKSHKMIEKFFEPGDHFSQILELAATNDQHLHFVKCSFDKYMLTDINKIKIKYKQNINNKILIKKVDATNLKHFADNSFDRVIVSCFVLHVENVSTFLSEVRRITKDHGYISLYVHCEPGLILRLSRFVIQLPKSYRIGHHGHLDLVYSEHRSYYLHIKYAVKQIFKSDVIKQEFYPLRFLTWNFNFWKIYTIRIIKEI